MFDQRYNANGIEENTLANILAMVLGYQLQEDQLHSTVSIRGEEYPLISTY